MSTAVKHFTKKRHRKDLRLPDARRLLRYLKPYLRMLFGAGAHVRAQPPGNPATEIHAVRERLVHPAQII